MTMTHKYLWYLGLLIWNGLPDDTKLSSKHNLKKNSGRRSYLCILWVSFHHDHFILIRLFSSLYIQIFHFI